MPHLQNIIALDKRLLNDLMPADDTILGQMGQIATVHMHIFGDLARLGLYETFRKHYVQYSQRASGVEFKNVLLSIMDMKVDGFVNLQKLVHELNDLRNKSTKQTHVTVKALFILSFEMFFQQMKKRMLESMKGSLQPFKEDFLNELEREEAKEFELKGFLAYLTERELQEWKEKIHHAALAPLTYGKTYYQVSTCRHQFQ